MSYGQSDLILDNDFNTFAQGHATNGQSDHGIENVNTLWGVGSDWRGYGQPDIITGVDPSDVITASSWSSLFGRIEDIATHQGHSLSWTAPAPNVSIGDTIVAVPDLATKINTIWTSPNSYTAGTRTSVFHGTNPGWSDEWENHFHWYSMNIFTVTFESIDKARYFFNAGGEIDFVFVQSGGHNTYRNLDWRDAGVEAGRISMNYNSLRADGVGNAAPGNSIATNMGYYSLTTSNTLLFKQYCWDNRDILNNFNYFTLNAKTNGTTNSNGGNGTVLTFETKFWDDTGDSHTSGGEMYTNGSYGVTMRITEPSETYLAKSWGTLVTPITYATIG